MKKIVSNGGLFFKLEFRNLNLEYAILVG